MCIYCMMQLCALCFKSCLQRLFLRADFSTTDRDIFFPQTEKKNPQLYILKWTVLSSSHNILYTQAASRRVIKSTLRNWSELTAHLIAIYSCSRICFLYVPPLFTLLLNSHHLKNFFFLFFSVSQPSLSTLTCHFQLSPCKKSKRMLALLRHGLHEL